MIHVKNLLTVFISLLIVILGFAFFSGGSKTISAFASNSTNLNYVALGDSITYGVGVTSPYPIKYKDYLSTDLGVSVNLTNLGVPFWFSSTLLDHLKNDQVYRDAVKNANLVTINIGTNNFRAAKYLYDQGICYDAQYNNNCLTFISNNFNNHLNDIIAQIKSLNNNPNNLVILLSDIYNPDISSYNQATAAIFIPFAAEINNIIHSVAATNGLGVTNVYKAFNGANGTEDPITKGYLVDGLHPNDSGHTAIADQFRILNSYLLDKDTDGDGFSNKVEKRMTTDMLSSCPTPIKPNAWPLDVYTLDNLGKVTVSDIVATIQKYMTNDSRYDFDGDGKVTIIDILTVKNHYYENCPQ